MVIDPSTPIGKIRLRVGDWQDLPLLPDSVIQSALDDCDSNIPRSASLCAQYILAMLTHKTHKKLAQLEVYGEQHFENYVKFIKLTILNPNLMSIAPVPYTGNVEEDHPIIAFQKQWNANYAGGTQSEQLARDAQITSASNYGM